MLAILYMVWLCISSVFSATQVSGYLDTYYAYAANKPNGQRRSFTTQPVRHNEPNINLGFVDIVTKSEEFRGRFALQGGNSVDRNYATEHDDTKHIQEAYAGIKVGDKTWIEGGIFFGNIGMESWISRDNWTYSRSLMLDNVPYYSAGLRLEHEISQTDKFQFQILNGWQNISETNNAKAIGMQYHKIIRSDFIFTYNNFLGDENVYEGQKIRFRTYHNFIFKYVPVGPWQYMGSFDVGEQSQQDKSGLDVWFATSLVVRRIIDDIKSLAMRLEHYSDSHQSNVFTGTPKGFQVSGASLNLDTLIRSNILFRNEVRALYSHDAIYSTHSGNRHLDSFFVSSLCLSL